MLGELFKKKEKENVSKERSLDDLLHASHFSNEEKFNNILQFARQILGEEYSKSEQHPIFDFIRILGRGIQSDYIKYLLYYDCEGGLHSVPPLFWSSLGLMRLHISLMRMKNLSALRN